MKNYDELIKQEKDAILAIQAKYQERLDILRKEMDDINNSSFEEQKDHKILLQKLKEMKFEEFLKSKDYLDFINGIKQNRVIPMTDDMKYQYLNSNNEEFVYYINTCDPSKYGTNSCYKQYRKLTIK